MKLETLEYKKLARMSHLGGELRHRLPKLAGKLLDTFGERLRKLANLTASLASARGRVGARARGKQMARATLRSDLVAIGRTARAIALDRPELDARRFRTPPNGEQRLLATARSVAAEAAPLRDAFLAHAMARNFLDVLNQHIQEFRTHQDGLCGRRTRTRGYGGAHRGGHAASTSGSETPRRNREERICVKTRRRWWRGTRRASSDGRECRDVRPRQPLQRP